MKALKASCGAALIAVLASFFMVGAVSAQTHQNRYGVIIWGKEYKLTAHVKYADKDANLIREVFVKALGVPAANIKSFDNPTKADLDRLFGREGRPGSLSSTIQHRDAELYVYFTGHGSKAVDAANNNQMESYLLAVDSDPNGLNISGFSYNDLLDRLSELRRDKMPEGRVNLIMESCFSGSYAEGELVEGVSAAAFGGEPLQRDVADDRITIISAATTSQVAYWDKDRENGVFTAVLADGLTGAADGAGRTGAADDRITYGELRAYLQNNVPARVRQMKKADGGANQLPQIAHAGDDETVVDFRGRGKPFIDELHQERALEKQENEFVVKKTIDNMNPTDLRKRLTLVNRRQDLCFLDCGVLEVYKTKIEQKLSICSTELQSYQRMLDRYGLDALSDVAGECECCEHKEAALRCIRSGSTDSQACACLLDDKCVTTTNPTCAPAFKQAKSAADTQMALAPLDNFARDNPSCPQVAEVRTAKTDACEVVSERIASSNDVAVLSGFLERMADCPQSNEIEQRVASIDHRRQCMSAWRKVETSRDQESDLAIFLERYRACSQNTQALRLLDTHVDDALKAADRARRQEEFDAGIRILDRFLRRFDVSMTSRNRESLNAAIGNLERLRGANRCKTMFEEARDSRSKYRLEAFISQNAKCPQIIAARELLRTFDIAERCETAWRNVRYSQTPSDIIAFKSNNSDCGEQNREADGRLVALTDACIQEGQRIQRTDRNAALAHLQNCVRLFNFAQPYFGRLQNAINDIPDDPIVVDPCQSRWTDVGLDEQARRQVIAYYKDLDEGRNDCAYNRWSRKTNKLMRKIRNVAAARVRNVRVSGSDDSSWATVDVNVEVKARGGRRWEPYRVRVELVRRSGRWLIEKMKLL